MGESFLQYGALGVLAAALYFQHIRQTKLDEINAKHESDLQKIVANHLSHMEQATYKMSKAFDSVADAIRNCNMNTTRPKTPKKKAE